MKEYEDEFKAVKAIMDTIFKNWPRLSPDSQIWVKSRLEALPANKVPVEDVERERD